jgi:hypothetical protein
VPTFQGTMFFTHGVQGWSETWYSDKGDAPTAFASFKNVALTRTKMLSAQAFLTFLRVSDIALRGDATVQSFDGTTTDKDAYTATSDVVGVGWYARFQSGSLYRRSLFLRGEPDDSFKLASNLSQYRDARPSPAFSQAFDTFVSTLTQEGWGLRVLKRDAGNPSLGVRDVTLEVGGTLRYILDVPDANFAEGSRIVLYKLNKLYPELVGRAQIKTKIATTYVLHTHAAGSPIATYKGGALVRQEVLIPGPITSGFLIRPAIRQTGRPSYLTRGRRRSR